MNNGIAPKLKLRYALPHDANVIADIHYNSVANTNWFSVAKFGSKFIAEAFYGKLNGGDNFKCILIDVANIGPVGFISFIHDRDMYFKDTSLFKRWGVYKSILISIIRHPSLTITAVHNLIYRSSSVPEMLSSYKAQAIGLYLDKKYRGAQIQCFPNISLAGTLIMAMERELIKRGIDKWYTNVSTENHITKNLYLKLGYSIAMTGIVQGREHYYLVKEAYPENDDCGKMPQINVDYKLKMRK